MTARWAAPTGLTIVLDQEEILNQVAKEYKKELNSRGHRVTRTKPLVAQIVYTCRGCKADFRGYTPIGHTKGGVIYSDFAEDNQCPKQQMNLEGS